MHKWISTDNGDECYRCGVVLDYRSPDDDLEVGRDGFERAKILGDAHRAAHELAPMGCNPTPNRSHHFMLIGTSDDFGYGLECAYGDAVNQYGETRITWKTVQVNNGPCIGA